jgi:hypothetical protein
VIEYRLTNINRAEPSPDLFVIPSDYTITRTTAERPTMSLSYAERNATQGVRKLP